jgi:C1A family cysteine protease
MTINLRPRRIKYLGWRPDTPDQRDRALKVTAPARIANLPKRVDLARNVAMPAVYDQGELGSCTANAIGAAFEYELRRQRLADFVPSRLAIYYGERFLEGTVNADAGAEIRDGMKVIAKEGTASEALWPYNVRRFAQRPPATYYAEALKRLCVSYERVGQTETEIKRALASGFPVAFGISVYESFDTDATAKSGKIPAPKPSEQLLGGHAILATGYGASTIQFRNSWGASWARGGYGSLSLDYVLNNDLADDFWIVKAVES